MSRRGHTLVSLKATAERAKTLLQDSWPLMLSGVAIMIYMKIDQIMLGQMVGDEAVGIYSAAVRVAEVWYFVPMAIAATVFPAILEAKNHSESLYLTRLQRLYDMMVIISVAIALPMTFSATPVVVFLFGDDYRGSGDVLALYIWASVFVFLGVTNGNWYLAEGLQNLALKRTLLGGGANIGLNLVLIPLSGATGAAVATIVSHAVAGYLADIAQTETRAVFLMKTRSLNIFAIFKRSVP